MHFPFKNKKITINDSSFSTLGDYSEVAEIPVLPHPGAFSAVRKNHIHEGIDLYCKENEEVFAMEKGIVVNISIFTGKEVNMPWWNTTWAIMVEGISGVINYGEINVLGTLRVGDEIQEGQLLGHVTTILKKNKGRPMNMLHLELYEHGVIDSCKIWKLDSEKPKSLKNPMILLENFIEKKT